MKKIVIASAAVALTLAACEKTAPDTAAPTDAVPAVDDVTDAEEATEEATEEESTEEATEEESTEETTEEAAPE